ncbi:hypothetical protein [Actinomycetospora corticicola]|uniref:Uncharacterized protein n=1 Tax=Actinomycetospora corticicola TaxID=663602 RepID=A0A7Y9DRY5_9PSEU|nr:hypothetical protein [Actinomycetospora corticicola]NYD34422.1 hypothetical protein [Actinomycetospora corticicola]
MTDPAPGTTPTASTAPSTTAPSAPGSAEALEQGCQCSFLLNDPAGQSFVNPLCPLHGAQHEGRVSAP